MLIKATKSQCFFLIKQKETLFVFYFLLGMVLINFTTNVLAFQGRDTIQMYQPMYLLLLSYNRINYNANSTLLFIQLYPLLVVCPAGFSFVRERQSGQDMLMAARLGYSTYIQSKLLSAFLTTTIIFSVTFLLEILLNCLSFPLEATGNLSNWNIYNSDYVQGVHNYLLSNFYMNTPFLYSIIGTLFFGVISGIFNAFTVAFSLVVRVKYRIFLFLPVFLLLNATIYIDELFPKVSASIKWYDYLLLFNDKHKSFLFLSTGLFMLLFFTVAAIFFSSRKESIL